MKKFDRPPSGARSAAPSAIRQGEHLEREVSYADISLTRLGVYISYERIAERAPSAKSVADTVALVVEDDPDQLALAIRRLGAAGYAVRTADSVKALHRRLEEGPPDAVFLDIGLPDGDGFDVLATLRQNPAYTHLPIIMLTAKAEPEDIAKGLALGADGYVTKPYSRNTLDYVLRYVMKQEVSVQQAPSASGRDPRWPLPSASPS